MTATMEPLVDTLTEDARWQAPGVVGKLEDQVDPATWMTVEGITAWGQSSPAPPR